MALKLTFPIMKLFNKGSDSKVVKTAKLGQHHLSKRLNIFGTLAAFFLIITVVSLQISMSEATYRDKYVAEAGKLRMLSQRFGKQLLLIMTGDAGEVDELIRSKKQYTEVIEKLDKGDEDLPATSGAAREVLNKLLAGSVLVQQDIKTVADSKADIETLENAMQVFEDNSEEMRRLEHKLIDSYTGEIQDNASRFSLAAERLAADAHRMLWDDYTPEQIAFIGTYADQLKAEFAMLPPNEFTQAISKYIDPDFNAAKVLVDNAAKLHKVKVAARAAIAYSDSQMLQSEKLIAAYQVNKLSTVTDISGPVSGLITLFLILMILNDYISDSTRRAKESELANIQNQKAILLLMNEFGDLADGDLTVRATVTEDITGAIADTLNFTTESFHKLVSRITTAADELENSTRDADSIAQGLMDVTQKQAVKIMDAGESVQLISKSIQEVDDSAAKATEVGQRTLVATDMGAQAVRNSIAGMDAIRDQIQDTAKRIKRLGERSQEIGEIVDLISDITEQTNVLALNAAIQATSAGEAGRGFSVVAEEVQRLAERSAEATKQIGALVKTIQSETQDAVVAMEKSTLGVVEGAKLSDVAGKSLLEIEMVSEELASLINSISVSTQVQTDMASEVASIMREILDITSKTTEGTRQTTNFVSQITSLAYNLKNSVATFKL